MKNTIKAAIYLGLILFLLATTGGCKHKIAAVDKHKLARIKMVPIEVAINQFKQITGYYPNKLDELTIFIHPIDGEDFGPFLEKSQLHDPWGNKYMYVPEGKVNQGSYDLISYGADGKPDGQGQNEDIYND